MDAKRVAALLRGFETTASKAAEAPQRATARLSIDSHQTCPYCKKPMVATIVGSPEGDIPSFMCIEDRYVSPAPNSSQD